MRLLDLFCGRGGWTKGFMAEGWECDGYDINEQPCYPGRFHRRDILGMTAADCRAYDFAVASSPCEEFSVHCMKHFHPNPKWPEMGIELFEHTRNILEQSGLPYVMENVRCAEKFVGRSVNHCGPFYLWGNAVPATMLNGLYSVRKGANLSAKAHYDWTVGKITREQFEEIRRDNWAKWGTSGSEARRKRTSQVAEIPLDLSRYIAQCAGSLLRQEVSE